MIGKAGLNTHECMHTHTHTIDLPGDRGWLSLGSLWLHGQPLRLIGLGDDDVFLALQIKTL
jgi:hypothetical protein